MVTYAPMKTVRFVSAWILIACLAAACGDDDAGDGGGGADAGGGMPPVISSVTWTHPAPCTAGTPSDVTVMIDVTDPDTPAANLTFSGSISSCTPAIASNPATVQCPQAAPYPATVTVTDPEGNRDSQTFTVRVCENGMAP